ncbi:MAG TPA: fructose-specific PTS transporter subunit EIIC [Nocardioidaceae bacterium]|nr:fructose-specific PTS transporter subunit EIIC [Nocardioidaceae bacterium]
MSALLTTPLVALDADLGAAKEEVIGRLAAMVTEAGRATDSAGLSADAMAREAQSATGLPGGIAIPHCRSGSVTAPSLAFARLDPGVDFGAPDGPADLVFLIAAPAGGESDHLTLLTALARALVRPDFTAALRAATSDAEVVALVDEAVGTGQSAPAPSGTDADAEANTEVTPGTAPATAKPTIVAVTACPTGIAHTYMAADSLVAAGDRAGLNLIVETQGSSTAQPLDASTIADADAVIFATDVGVRGRERFAGKPVVASGVKRAINDPDAMVRDALAAASDPDAPRVKGDRAEAESAGTAGGDVHWGVRLRQWLLTGVSYMIPFVAAGGLLIALGFLLGGYQIADNGQDIAVGNSLWNLPDGGLSVYLGAVLFTLGSLAFGFLVPALSGYIAFAIADRPGIAPGFAVGVVAVTVQAGFIGGLVGGLLAGLSALWISRLPVWSWARGLMPVVVIPLFATMISGGLMLMVLGRPLAAATEGLESWLNGMTGTSALLLGAILGAMMAFDLGGPVNKAAYAFATAGLSGITTGEVGGTAPLVIMAAVMAAGMTPPLAMALATTVRPRLFSPAEQENGKAAWLLGLSFISEGAIPFAAADLLRVIPSMMVGSAAAGAIIMNAGVTLRAPHGGIFVFFAMQHVLWFLAALAVGTALSALCVVVLKEISSRRTASAPAASYQQA